MPWRLFALFIVFVGIVLAGLSVAGIEGGAITANARIIAPVTSLDGFARAIEPYDWQFPADFGPHPEFQTEWWYYTGNVATADGRRFGYQFTIFRRAITPQAVASASEWRTNQLYLAHFTISDIANERFYHDERFSRGSASLAGATVDPLYRVWLEDWEVMAQDEQAERVTIRAHSDDFALEVLLEQTKPPALQGQAGLSPKSAEEGNASYYYTLSRLITTGTITLGDEIHEVTGNTWRDHEFSTSALGDQAQGWDWFGLIFDDGTELMVGQIRLTDGGREPAFGGLYIAEDGTTRYLTSEDFTIVSTRTWASPHTGAVYPAGWQITLDAQDMQFSLLVDPLMADQELHGANVEYWEGAVRISGDKQGYGYAELTGYVDTMQGRF